LQEYLDDPNFEQNRLEYRANKRLVEKGVMPEKAPEKGVVPDKPPRTPEKGLGFYFLGRKPKSSIFIPCL
jgi:hypothetical protein